jgi:hypothetical protein
MNAQFFDASPGSGILEMTSDGPEKVRIRISLSDFTFRFWVMKYVIPNLREILMILGLRPRNFEFRISVFRFSILHFSFFVSQTQDLSQHVIPDRQTDRQTDGRTRVSSLYRPSTNLGTVKNVVCSVCHTM